MPNKITLKDSSIKFQISNFKFFANQLFNKKKKIHFDNLNIKMFDEEIPIITFKNINFINFGYKKNLIIGKVFDKNFQVKINNNFNNINFTLLNSGIKTEISFDENQKQDIKYGTFKSKILNTNFKSNFEYDSRVIKIYNSYFRSKDLSFKNNSEIILDPFLDINAVFIIDELNAQILKNLNLSKLLRFKQYLIEINNKSEIIFKPRNFNRMFFDDLNIKLNLAYGRINYSKRILIKKNNIKCDGSINFLEEYPLLFFDCQFKLQDKKEFLKKFSLKTKNKNEIFELNVSGNLSVLKRKVYFKNISTNDNYIASKEDLKYFKNAFEEILYDKNFYEIFDLKKIKEFILEIS